MPRQKRGFLLFICSLIPGAGEMYMGLFKQGISIMTLFWAIIALAGGLNLEYLVIFLPVIWFYSFFHVHNLKDLPEEEFYAIEDNYILHLNDLFRNTGKITTKYQKTGAVLLIFFGIIVLWNSFRDLLYWIIPGYLGNLIQDIMYQLPPVVVGILIIIAGFHILEGKLKAPLTDSFPEKEPEHYWQPSIKPFPAKSSPDKPSIKVSGVQLSKKTEASETPVVPASDSDCSNSAKSDEPKSDEPQNETNNL